MLVAFAVVVQADLHRRLFHGDCEQDLLHPHQQGHDLALLRVPKLFAGFGGAAGKRSPVAVFSVYPYCGRLGGSDGGGLLASLLVPFTLVSWGFRITGGGEISWFVVMLFC